MTETLLDREYRYRRLSALEYGLAKTILRICADPERRHELGAALIAAGVRLDELAQGLTKTRRLELQTDEYRASLRRSLEALIVAGMAERIVKMAMKEKSHGGMKIPKGYEDSKFDRDKGVKEGSKEDRARDKKGVAEFKAAQMRDRKK